MSIVWLVLAGYLAVLVLVFVFQRSLMYPASTDRPELEDAVGDGYRVVATRQPDGLELEHWFRPPTGGAAAPVVVVFHGNGGHIGHRTAKYRFLLERGCGLFLAEYPGYGGNPGRPTEETIMAAGRAVLDYLASEEGVAGGRLVLYGESLGAGPAVKLAAGRRIGALILESPYTSLAAVAQRHYWYLPAYWLTLDRWDIASVVAGIDAPLLVMHGERDTVIPTDFGRRLLKAAAEPKQALFLSQAGHNDVLEHAEAREAVLKFLAGLAQ